MSSTFDATADAITAVEAHAALDDLMAWVGVDGLVAALRSPGLLAEVDQHAAAVRDAVAAAGRELDAPALYRYARSVVAAAHRMGRELPAYDGSAAGADWTGAGWHLVRLVAVCALATGLCSADRP
jgi:Family of unknown function (DUF6401)